MQKTILMYGFNDPFSYMQTEQLKSRLTDTDIAVRVVKKEEYSLAIGLLAGVEISDPLAGRSGHGRPEAIPELRPRMLVLCGLTSDETDRLLALFPECGITKDDLKAVLTATNAMWHASYLHAELSEEHREMNKMN